MNANAIQRLPAASWRCHSCGDEKPSAGSCPGCGASPRRRSDRNRLIAPVQSMETFGNENVQQNVVHVYGDVDVDNSFESPSYRPVPNPGPSPVMSGLYAACTAAIWVSAIAVGLVTAFFVVIFIKAFIIHGL